MAHKPPDDPAEHAADFAKRYAEPLDRYCALRMEELGIPNDRIGASDHEHDIAWCAFNPHDRDGGNVTNGITINSGVLNPDLLRGEKGGRVWQRMRLRDRIDAVIAHEWAESRHGTHAGAVKAAARTKLRISEGARRVLRAMAR